jgi:hypothetical protein
MYTKGSTTKGGAERRKHKGEGRIQRKEAEQSKQSSDRREPFNPRHRPHLKQIEKKRGGKEKKKEKKGKKKTELYKPSKKTQTIANKINQTVKTATAYLGPCPQNFASAK